MRTALLLLTIGLTLAAITQCQKNGTKSPVSLTGATWAEKLGYPANTKVLILHADDMGMCPEANAAGTALLAGDHIQSAAVMMPCPSAADFLAWYKQHPDEDIGLHLTLTAEWKNYRWGPVAHKDSVPGLLDPDGYLWRDVPDVANHASAKEVETEIRAQIEKAKAMGVHPGHMDTHMGTLYGRPDYTAAYLKVAAEYGIPAMAIEFTESVVTRFRAQGYPINEDMIKYVGDYPLPKLDDFRGAPDGDSYADKKQKFMDLVHALSPGITEIIFHPSVETDNLKSITNSWQQRVWEAQMFTDPDMKQFFRDEGVLFTNWKEIMKRFRERTNS